MPLTLFVPDLLWPEPGDPALFEGARTPGLARLLGRAPCRRQPARPPELALAAALGWPEAPLGALRLLGEGEPAADMDHWLCADPVHLRFHHERIVLADAGAFSIPPAEAEALIDSLNRTFADLGEFRCVTPERWYLRLKAPVEHAAAPLSAVAGRRIDRSATGTQGLAPVLNEIQMCLHTHPVNAARTERGEPAINSLWLWGAGARGAAPDTCPHTAILSDDPLARGLARALGCPALPLPRTLAEVPAAAGDHPCVVLDSLAPGVRYEEAGRWQAALSALDAAWFAPLAAYPAAHLPLRLIAPTIYGELILESRRPQAWQFWKRPLAPATLARTLAESA